MTSIRRWLLGWLIFGLTATSLAAAYGIFHTARREASELFDYELRTVALSLPANIATADAAERRSHSVNGIADDRIAIDIWDKQGKLVYHSLKESALPRIAEGFRSIERGEYRWRVFGLQQPGRYIQVARPFSVREDFALGLVAHVVAAGHGGAGDHCAGIVCRGPRTSADRWIVESAIAAVARLA